MNRHLALDIRITRSNREAQILGDPLTNIVEGYLIISLEGEAVDVHEGQFATALDSEKVLVAGVHTAVATQELDGGSGQVHDEVRDGGRDVDALGLRLGSLLGARGRLGGDEDVLAVLVGFKD